MGRLPELRRVESSQPGAGWGPVLCEFVRQVVGGGQSQTGKRSSIRPSSTAEGREELRLEEQMPSQGRWEQVRVGGPGPSGLRVIAFHSCSLHGEVSEEPAS